MKFRRKNTSPDAEGAQPPSPPPRDWTAALDALTGPQVKALLLVASDSPDASSPLPHMDLVERAARETTTVEELTALKEQAKSFAKDAADGRHRDGAQLLYHVAVAAAFVHHGAAISGRPMRKQHTLYEELAAKWSEHPIGRLFRDAADRVAGTKGHT
jgi:hypothetical protein